MKNTIKRGTLMKYFKISATRTADRYEINSKEFSKNTHNKFPYVQSVAENVVFLLMRITL